VLLWAPRRYREGEEGHEAVRRQEKGARPSNGGRKARGRPAAGERREVGDGREDWSARGRRFRNEWRRHIV
jgi:hypothetical protein